MILRPSEAPLSVERHGILVDSVHHHNFEPDMSGSLSDLSQRMKQQYPPWRESWNPTFRITIDRMTSLDPLRAQNPPPSARVQRHEAASPIAQDSRRRQHKGSHQRSAGDVAGRIVHFFQVKTDRLGEVGA